MWRMSRSTAASGSASTTEQSMLPLKSPERARASDSKDADCSVASLPAAAPAGRRRRRSSRTRKGVTSGHAQRHAGSAHVGPAPTPPPPHESYSSNGAPPPPQSPPPNAPPPAPPPASSRSSAMCR